MLPVMNGMVTSNLVADINNASATTHWALSTAKEYPLFSVPHAVDVSGMELGLAFVAAANTLLTQTIASAASTLEIVIGDAGTTGTGNAAIMGGDDFSNTRADGFTLHEAIKASPSGTTDLDADDWLVAGIIANATDLAGAVQVSSAFIYGIPGAIS
jgi:hypothetical protein